MRYFFKLVLEIEESTKDGAFAKVNIVLFATYRVNATDATDAM